MNKYKKIIIPLLLSALVLGGLVIYLIFFSEKQNQPTPVSSSQGLRALFEQCQKLDYDKIPGYGINTRDIFYKIAEIITSKDEEACSQLGDAYKEICFRYQYISFAVSGKNYTSNYFDKLSEKDRIIAEAYVNNDINLCDSLKDILMGQTCKAMVALDQNFCNFTGDAFDNTVARSLCLNSYYFIKALKEKNINECYKIEDIKGGAPVIDKNSISTSTLRSLKEGEVVNNIFGRMQQIFCVSLLSSHPKEEINKFYREDACYEKYAVDLAKFENNPSLCEKIPLKETYNKIRHEECVSQFK